MTISTEEEDANYSSDEELEIDNVIVTDIHRSLSIQTDLTMHDLSNMEFDNQKHREELCTLQGRNAGYPSKVQLQYNNKLPVFYTGLQSFMTIYEFVKKGVNLTGYYKLSEFEFLLTLMKLCLNLSNYDLSFRFGICL